MRRIAAGYDGQGNLALVTSYDAATSGSVVNQVQLDYNGLGQLTSDWQAHGGAVGGGTPRVQYAYSGMPSGADHSRLTTLTYPDGRTVTSNYSTGLNDSISRLSSLTDGSTTLEGYDYLGLGTVVRRSHPETGGDLTYIKRTGESVGDAGDQYTGLDRFGRVADQRWLVASSGTAVDRSQYTYDRDSNRTARANGVNAAFDETYTYDGLNQLASFARGSHTLAWDYDAAGNFDSVTTDGGSPVTRSANKQNEITTISGATTPAFDAAGNMTGDEGGKTLVYDAWHRLVAYKTGSTVLAAYAYDGLGRRITETAGGTTTDLYYSAGWQVLKERVGGVATNQYVWSPVYVDALVERDRDADGNSGTGTGGREERLYAVQDANWNTTALVSTSGTVVERYAYDPFGRATVYDSSYAVRSGGSSYGWVYAFQGLRHSGVTGLDQAVNRDYSPALGRWTSTDPIGFGGGDANLYGFVGNGPTAATDPSGLVQQGGTFGAMQSSGLLNSGGRTRYAEDGTLFCPQPTLGDLLNSDPDRGRLIYRPGNDRTNPKDYLAATGILPPTAGDEDLSGYGSRANGGSWGSGDLFRDLSNFAAGAADALTGGLTARSRQGYGTDDVVDKDSGAYKGGKVAGSVLAVVTFFVNPCGAVAAAGNALRAINGIQAAGAALNSRDAFNRGDYLEAGLEALGVVGGVGYLRQACFVAGTPLRTPGGESKPVEAFRPGDLVLSRSEHDPNGPLTFRRVLQTFQRVSPILDLVVEGRVIGTTGEHPFYVNGRGWVPAGCLRPGDELLAADGRWLPVTAALDAGRIATVYNFEVEGDHTYFVGGDEWGFSVWAHNANYNITDGKGIVRYTGMTGQTHRLQEALTGRIREGIKKVRELTGIARLQGKVIPGTEKLSPAFSEAVEAALIKHHGIRPNGTLVNKLPHHNSSFASLDDMLEVGRLILKKIKYPGF